MVSIQELINLVTQGILQLNTEITPAVYNIDPAHAETRARNIVQALISNFDIQPLPQEVLC
jgi:hypothetical protein